MEKSKRGFWVGGIVLAIVVAFSLGIINPISVQAAEMGVDEESQTIEELKAEIKALKKSQKKEYQTLLKELAKIHTSGVAVADVPHAADSKFSFGGYGEIHWNGIEGEGNDYADIHRFVLYMGYHFNDWISLHSETEIEHAYVKGGNGEVAIEQLALDFYLTDTWNIRAGRILLPFGITNSIHEPPTFNGVERPDVEKNIIPSTWFAEGAGLFGSFGESFEYQAFIVNGLDASGFAAKDGIRGGRMKERPGIYNPAFIGRLDYLPSSLLGVLKSPKLGVSFYDGGANNQNKGGDNDLDVEVKMVDFDIQGKVGPLNVKALYVLGMIEGASKLADPANDPIANEISGYYGEASMDIMPSTMKSGKLEDSKLNLFARYEAMNTHAEMPEGVVAMDKYDRSTITTGLTFLPIPNLAVKADYQVFSDAADTDFLAKVNFGIGWMF